MRAGLKPLDGGPVFDLDKDLVVVGRGEESDLRIDHKSVSKLHCVLVKTDGLILLRDLGSTNGTRVNGTRVRRAALLPNDVLAFANFRYAVQFGDPSPRDLVPAPVGETKLETGPTGAGASSTMNGPTEQLPAQMNDRPKK